MTPCVRLISVVFHELTRYLMNFSVRRLEIWLMRLKEEIAIGQVEDIMAVQTVKQARAESVLRPFKAG